MCGTTHEVSEDCSQISLRLGSINKNAKPLRDSMPGETTRTASWLVPPRAIVCHSAFLKKLYRAGPLFIHLHKWDPRLFSGSVSVWRAEESMLSPHSSFLPQRAHENRQPHQWNDQPASTAVRWTMVASCIGGGGCRLPLYASYMECRGTGPCQWRMSWSPAGRAQRAKHTSQASQQSGGLNKTKKRTHHTPTPLMDTIGL